jgi:hypothetical protein
MNLDNMDTPMLRDAFRACFAEAKRFWGLHLQMKDFIKMCESALDETEYEKNPKNWVLSAVEVVDRLRLEEQYEIMILEEINWGVDR